MALGLGILLSSCQQAWFPDEGNSTQIPRKSEAVIFKNFK